MLFLTFHLDAERYALATADIVEVMPFVTLRQLPQAPDYVAGLLDYRGQLVPAIDLTALALGRASAAEHGTRIVLVRYPCEDGQTRLLGLLAEQVVETVKLDPQTLDEPGVTVEAAQYLGKVARDDNGVLQTIDVGDLLPREVQEILYREPA